MGFRLVIFVLVFGGLFGLGCPEIETAPGDEVHTTENEPVNGEEGDDEGEEEPEGKPTSDADPTPNPEPTPNPNPTPNPSPTPNPNPTPNPEPAPLPTPIVDQTAVSFVTFGDWGGGDLQKAVASAIGTHCRTRECEFVLTLGDNFYDDGVASVSDPQWQTKYHDIYDGLGLPFYAVLGNHDTAGNEQAQIDRSSVDSTWRMPGEYYSVAFPQGGSPPQVEFFVFNTENFSTTAEQWLNNAIGASQAAWKILAMHVPIISNGPHGNDERHWNGRLIPVICNRIDLVISGHDHIFSHLRQTVLGCPIEQLVIGTGGIGLYNADKTDPRVLSSGEFHGFGWLQVDEKAIDFQMVKSDASVYYQYTWQKP